MAETWSARELLNAGWIEADLAWEEAAERAADAAAHDDYMLAKDEAGKALQLARADFEPIDPRLGTSLANYGLCLSLSGHSGSVAALFREALDVWRRAEPWIARMDAPRVARSSLFHMRMEALHRDTYRARWQERWQEMAAEAKARIGALHAGRGVAGATGAESLAHWRRERPAMLNDTRKLMAASFLLLAPPAPKTDGA
ncbi:MAG TPA: hypothetical protein VLE24_02290 [Methyloceanibacter sp.]|nr:hypothetical protein [Methyloceanibacter sp.]